MATLANTEEIPAYQPPSKSRRISLHLAATLLVIAIALAQLIYLIASSLYQWHHFAQTIDFDTFTQALWLIGRGHFAAFSYVYGSPFWQNQFNLAFYPLALIWPVFHSAFPLLVVQDLALASCTAIAGLFILQEATLRLAYPARYLLPIAFALALAVSPTALETSHFDFHMESIAAPLLLLAGWAGWRGRNYGAVALGLLAALTGVAGAVFVLGLGLGLVLTGRRHAKSGLLLAAIGALVIMVAISLSASRGTPLAQTYGYLTAGRPQSSGWREALVIVEGSLIRPLVPIKMLLKRAGALGVVARAGGIIGVFSGIGTGAFGLIALANGLNSSPNFTSISTGSFGNFPSVPLLIVGSAFLAIWLIARSTRLTKTLGALLAILALAASFEVAAIVDPTVNSTWIRVAPAAVKTLTRTLSTTPPAREVAVVQGISGRFATRLDFFPITGLRPTIPLLEPKAEVILAPVQGVETFPAAKQQQAIAYLAKLSGTRLLRRGGGVWVYLVTRNAATGSSITLP